MVAASSDPAGLLVAAAGARKLFFGKAQIAARYAAQ